MTMLDRLRQARSAILGALIALPGTGTAAELPAVGSVIDGTNVGRFAALLDDTLVELVTAGDFTLAITASTPFPVHPAYAAATAAHANDVRLGDAPGELEAYVAGRPFPQAPRGDDPRAGEKIAWNMRYAWGGDGGRIAPFYWQYRNMRGDKVERELSFEAASLRFRHRIVEPPLPDFADNPAGIFNALYLRVMAPPDIRDTQLLIHRLSDDTRQEQGWLYLGTQRRVRRLPTGQNTDAFLGSDIMIEDFLGYNGRIMDMDWRYVETRDVLLPFYAHDAIALGERAAADGFTFIAFGGTGHCFPQVAWQFRTAHVVEATPKWGEHPLSKRLYYVDAETYAPAYGRLYDNRGKLWKFAIAAYSHPDHHLAENRGSHAPILDGVTMIDLQAGHCTTLEARSVIGTGTLKPGDFAVQALRKQGR
ncbi:MAG: DUF1329 domain-containing protein [Gammaproteobacteria bacterium]